MKKSVFTSVVSPITGKTHEWAITVPSNTETIATDKPKGKIISEHQVKLHRVDYKMPDGIVFFEIVEARNSGEASQFVRNAIDGIRIISVKAL